MSTLEGVKNNKLAKIKWSIISFRLFAKNNGKRGNIARKIEMIKM